MDLRKKMQVELIDSNGIYLTYQLSHKVNGWLNVYTITAKICGISGIYHHSNSLYISAQSVIEVVGNNEETLMDEFAVDLLDDYLNR
jgi:hypothetical protein